MSGFVGVLQADGRPVDEVLLTKLLDPIAHRGPDHQDTWARGSMGIAAAVFRLSPESAGEIQPVVGSSGAVVVFDGRLDDRAGLIDRLRCDPALTDPELVVLAWERFGEDLTSHLAGEWALAVLDPRRGEAMLARDPVGTKPLYVAKTSEAVVFASEIKAILGYPGFPVAANDDLIAYVLMSGPARDNAHQTFFRDVWVVEPGWIVRASPRGLRKRQVWDFDPGARTRLATYEDYVDAFRERFEVAVRRRLRSSTPVAVSVSGGLDSSSVMCQALALRERDPSLPAILGFTHESAPGSPSYEMGYVHAIEDRWGVEIATVPLVADQVVPSSSQQVWISETPWVDEYWTTVDASKTAIRASGARAFMTGLFGDQFLWDQAYLVDLANRGRLLTVAKHLLAYPRWDEGSSVWPYARRFAANLLRWNAPKSLVPLLRQVVPSVREPKRDRPWYTSTFRQHAFGPAPREVLVGPSRRTIQGRVVYSKLKSKYYVMGMEAEDKISAAFGLQVLAPMLDRDLLAFMMSVPGEVTAKDGKTRSLLRDAMAPVLPASIAGRRDKSDFTSQANEALAEALTALRRGGSDEHAVVRNGYVQPWALRPADPSLQERVGDADALGVEVADLIGLEAWLLRFHPEERPI